MPTFSLKKDLDLEKLSHHTTELFVLNYWQFLVKLPRSFLLKLWIFQHKLHLSLCCSSYCDTGSDLEMSANHKPFEVMLSIGQNFAVWVIALSHVELSVWEGHGPKVLLAVQT